MSHDATKNLNEVMRKYDRESNTRAWEGKPKIAVQAYLAAFAIFEVYVTLFGTMLDEVRLTSFVGGLLIAGFLIFPSHKHEFRVNYVPWYDWVIMALGAVSFFYFCFNANQADYADRLRGNDAWRRGRCVRRCGRRRGHPCRVDGGRSLAPCRRVRGVLRLRSPALSPCPYQVVHRRRLP